MPTADFAVNRIPQILRDRVQALGLAPIVADLARADASPALFNQYLNRLGGVTLVSLVDSTAIASLAVETVFAPAATQQFIFPANSLNVVGRRVRFKASGSMASTVTPNIILNVRLGGLAGVLVGSGSALVLANNSTAAGWKVEGGFVVRTIGAAATLRGENQRTSIANIAAAAGPALDSLGNNAIANVVADLTAALSLVVTANWSAANAANTITMTTLQIEVYG